MTSTKHTWGRFAAVVGVLAAIAGIVSTVYTVIDHAKRPESRQQATQSGVPASGGAQQTSSAPATGADARTIYLSDLEPVEGKPETGERTVFGATYQHSIAMYLCFNTETVGYNLARRYARLHVVIGFADTSESTAVANVVYQGSGR